MATANRPQPTETRIDPAVSHPLDHLRGTIRRYVVLEGLLTAGLFLVGWFAVGLVLDFGVFKAFTLDWVQDAPRWVRAIGLVVAVGLLLFILVRRIALRLT